MRTAVGIPCRWAWLLSTGYVLYNQVRYLHGVFVRMFCMGLRTNDSCCPIHYLTDLLALWILDSWRRDQYFCSETSVRNYQCTLPSPWSHIGREFVPWLRWLFAALSPLRPLVWSRFSPCEIFQSMWDLWNAPYLRSSAEGKADQSRDLPKAAMFWKSGSGG